MRKIASWILPLAGMTFFWRYFYASAFFNVLFPPGSFSLFLGMQVHVSIVFLIELLLLSLVVLALRDLLAKILQARKFIVVLVAACASLSTFFFFNLPIYEHSTPFAWALSAFIALGFIANCLAWANFFSLNFGPRSVLILILSYLLSLAIFPTLSLFFETTRILLLLAPVLSGLAWFFSASSTNPLPKGFQPVKDFSFLKSLEPYALLFVVFLITGSAVRGIVDNAPVSPSLRWGISLAVGCIILLLFWIFCGRPRMKAISHNSLSEGTYSFFEKAVFKTWVALASLFLISLFAGLLMSLESLSGDLVVIARSFLDLFLWVLLCNLAYYKKFPSVPLFTVCILLVETVSWCLSYIIVPFLLGTNTSEGGFSQNRIGLWVVFVLFISVTILLSSIVIKRQSNVEGRLSINLPLSGAIPPEIIKHYGLTKREVEIVGLFVQGRSLRKVASILVISTSTAQSHMKSAYRKLDIHSKDELIDAFAEWTS